MSFVVHKSVLPPTGADACVSCFFTPHSNSNNNNDFKEAFENDENDENEDENVIVASGNRLTIYSVKRRRRKERGEECDDEEEKEDLNEDEEIVVVRLEVISEFDVNGTISDLCVLKHFSRQIVLVWPPSFCRLSFGYESFTE